MRYNNSETYRVYNPATRRIMESKNVILIETQSRLLPPPSEETSPQISYSSNGMDDYNIINRDFLRDLRDYTSVLEPLPGASADHIAVGRLSANPPMAELLERISEITGRDILDGEAAGPPQQGAMPGGAPTEGVSQEGVLQPLEQPELPAGAFLETPLAGSPPVQQQMHSRLEVTPAVTQVGTAAQSFERLNADKRSNSAHLAAVTTEPALSELRGLRLCSKATLADIARETYGADPTVEYAYPATTMQSFSARENTELISNTIKEAMTVSVKSANQ